MFFCCCAKPREDKDDQTINGMEGRLKNVNRILIQFVTEEQKLGLKEVPCIDIIERILIASNKGEVPKKEIIQIYKSLSSISQGAIKNFLIQNFFFVDEDRQKYDFNKIVLLNILYSGGKDHDKANFLFNVLEKSTTSCIHNHEHRLINTIEYLTYIPCISVGEILNSVRRFNSDQEDQEFQELLSLYSTNNNMLREFAIHLISTYLFPSSQEKQVLMRQDFVKKMEDSQYLLIKPHEIRKKYTEYVFNNKARALLPSRQLRRTTYQESEEIKSNGGESIRQSINIRGTYKSSKNGKKNRQEQPRSTERDLELYYQKNDKRSNGGSKSNRAPPGKNQRDESDERDFMNKSISDKSMILYRYEDNSQRPTQINHQQKHNSQQRKSSTRSDNDVSPIQSPGHNGYLNDSNFQNKLQNITIQQQLNNSGARDTDLTTNSFTTKLRKYPSVSSYLNEMFGEQFVTFVHELQEPLTTKKQQRLKNNMTRLQHMGKVLEFPDFNSFPYHVRQIFEYYKALITKEELLAFANGTLYSEKIVNLYLRILEKANLVLQSQYNFSRATTRNSIDQTTRQQPLKIQYFNTNFSRRINDPAYLKDCINQLKDFFKYDMVILPFFFDEENDQRALLVVIRVATSTVDLYDRERETDNHDISETVLYMLDLASHIIELEFSEEQIDGGVEGICVSREEDMLVSMCHIAECVTFNKQIDLEVFNVKQERQRIVDTLTALLNFT